MPGVTTAYQTGVHGSRPANGSGCVLYSCTTHSLVYRDDGTTWITFMTLGTAGAYVAGGTDVAVADGGTGASTAAGARTNLGLVLGTDVASLTAGVVPIAQLATGTPTGTKFIRDDGTLQVPAGGAALTVEEVDGSPTDAAIVKIVFPNGTLGIASHVATYTPAGGGGGGSSSLAMIYVATIAR